MTSIPSSKRKPFSFPSLIKNLKLVFQQIPDPRTGKNSRFPLHNVLMGAFSVFFLQCPSFLAHQRSLQKKLGQNNARSLFDLSTIPTDPQIRTLLDPLSPSLLTPQFFYYFSTLEETGSLQSYRFLKDQFLIALDGTEYFSSQNISCKKCSSKTHKDGSITYSHQAITPVLVHPNKSEVISLEPEFIVPQDGHEKQDCEIQAAKRWMNQYGGQYKGYGVTLLGDDLYSRQPFCELAIEKGMKFIFTCKEDSHESLYKWVKTYEEAGELGRVVEKKKKGKGEVVVETYRYLNDVALYEGAESVLRVNWCEIEIRNSSGKVTYKNAVITNHRISDKNVKDIIKAGRSRWKIENENNNTLKTKGYHLEHNFGHGKENLSSLLVTLNLMAFLFHTILSLMDKSYQLIRKEVVSRKTFFEYLRALTNFMYFKDWNTLLKFMLNALELRPPHT
jgi:hypothetical protein